MTLWRQRCALYHGVNGIHTIKRNRKNAAARAATAYRETLGNLTPMANILLHRDSLNNMMTWTKQHLDAYLTTAEVLCEWNVEPG